MRCQTCRPLYSSWLIMKGIMYVLSSINSNWWNEFLPSNFATIVAFLNLWICCSIVGKGYFSLIIALLACLMSTQILIFPLRRILKEKPNEMDDRQILLYLYQSILGVFLFILGSMRIRTHRQGWEIGFTDSSGIWIWTSHSPTLSSPSLVACL